MTHDPRSPQEIERDIAIRRAELSENVKHLKASLSVGSLKQKAGKIGLRHASDLGGSALEQVKKNPLPMAAVGASLAWLLYANAKGQSVSNDTALPPTLPNPQDLHIASEPETVNTRPVQDTFARHPFLYGALALAAGAALSRTLPRSKAESDLIASAQDLLRTEKEKLANISRKLKEEAEAIISETKHDMDNGALCEQSTADTVQGLAKGAADRMLSAAVSAAKDAKSGEP